jgi:hypothetical protein
MTAGIFKGGVFRSFELLAFSFQLAPGRPHLPQPAVVIIITVSALSVRFSGKTPQWNADMS